LLVFHHEPIESLRKWLKGNLFLTPLLALRSAFRNKTFWLLAGTFFFCGFSTNGLIGTHLIHACGDYGIPEVMAAGLLAMMGLFDLFGTTLSGWLSDRFDNVASCSSPIMGFAAFPCCSYRMRLIRVLQCS
jgi:hypothetical protein